MLAFPTLASRARERALGLSGRSRREIIDFVNAQVRTIARVIVHPQFRGLGLASLLIRRVCDECPTRYVEAFAAMGDVHPLFEQGGMTRTNAKCDDEDAYFILDRELNE